MPVPRGGAWKRTGRLSGAAAGAQATRVYVCNGCGVWHEDAKPAQCMACGRMDFTFWASKGEAKYWARLELEQRAGRIRGLRRQVPVPLMTVGREGLPVKWGEAVLDYAYFTTEDDREHLLDWKPSTGISRETALKLRCLEAQGIEVELVNSKGMV
jgi:hypothetical protein